MRRNLHKSYLLELQAQGVAVVPTILLKDTGTLDAVLRAQGWTRAVAKPAVSATAFNTSIVQRGASLPPGEWLIQPFLEEIPRDGEWSFIFLGGTYSHCVLKRAAAGDFRVQADFWRPRGARRRPARTDRAGPRHP